MNTKSAFPIEVVLVVAAQETLPDKKHLNKFLVLRNEDEFSLPSVFLAPGQKTKELAAKLLFDYTGVEEFWLPIFHLGLYESDGGISVLYYVVMHEPTRIRVDGSGWYTYEELNNVTKSTLEIISEAVCRKM